MKIATSGGFAYSLASLSANPTHGNIYINSVDKKIHYLSGGYWHRVAILDSVAAPIVAPSLLTSDGYTLAWFRWNEAATITKDAQDSVQRWTDYLGSGIDVKAANNSKRSPVWSTDGITFNGTTNFLKTDDVVTWGQPIFIYIVMKQVSLTTYTTFLANDDWSVKFFASNTTPNIAVSAGTGSSNSTDLHVGDWGVVRMYFNGATSKLIVNANAPITGNFGAGTLDQFVIGGDGSDPSTCAHFIVRDIIVRDSNIGESDIYSYCESLK